MPDISIVLVTRDSANVVQCTLDSIREQKIHSWECIVVDDGSTDGTPALVERLVGEDPRFSLVRQSHGGTPMARNRGFMESLPTSKYVSFVDAGDVWDGEALEQLTACLEDDAGAVGVHCVAKCMEGEDRLLSSSETRKRRSQRLGFQSGVMVECATSEPTGFENLLWADLLSPSGIFLARRTAFEKVGMYDPDLGECSQWDMGLRLARIGVIRFLDQVLLYHRCGSTDARMSGVVNGKNVRRLQRKTFSSSENSEQQREALKRSWRAWHWFQIKETFRSGAAIFSGRASLRELRAIAALAMHALEYVVGGPCPL